MFEPNDESRLIRLLASNNVILFLGAGFSYDTINKLGKKFPLGITLSEEIYHFLGYPEPYDNTSLPEMYTALLNSGIKTDKLRNFLESELMVSTVPEIYTNIAKPYWYKIYTLNVDNVLDEAYKRAGKYLRVLSYPHDEFEERDQSLELQQTIYLNGKLPANPNELIFSRNQYANATLIHQPLYQQFVFDYSVKAVIFIGTEINEPIFESYLAARQNRKGREFRPKSFLITPSLSIVKADNYRKEYNVEHIKGTTKDFLKWLESVSSTLPTRDEILKVTFPNLVKLLVDAGDSGKDSVDVKAFAETFNKVPQDYQIRQERSGFLLGATPSWNDIFRELDIPRSITNYIFSEIIAKLTTTQTKLTVIGLFGTAGSGKSTIIKRLSLRIAQEGHLAYLSYSDYMPAAHSLTNALKLIDKRTVLFFDNAENLEYSLPKLITAVNHLSEPPIIVLAARTSSYNKITRVIDADVDYINVDLPDLDDDEISDLIDKLDNQRLLGVLNGLNSKQRFDAFKKSAKKQILIAMKEATSGQLFDSIIKDEFEKIEPREAQILCICIALNTERGFTNSRQDFVGFSKVGPSEALDYLAGTLKGTIVYGGAVNNEKLMLRHRVVAEYFIKHCATSNELKEAYVRVLSILAPELNNSQGPSRKFNLYRSLINHTLLYERFAKNIDQAREVYDSIAPFFSDDFQFWLQYGSLELEGSSGNLELAENYINQAESLYARSAYVQNAKCSLLYKKSLVQDTISKAYEYKEQADVIAARMLGYGNENGYIYHIYCNGRYQFMKHWIEDLDVKKDELNHLIYTIGLGTKNYPFDKRLQKVEQDLTKALYSLAVSPAPIDISSFESGL